MKPTRSRVDWKLVLATIMILGLGLAVSACNDGGSSPGSGGSGTNPVAATDNEENPVVPIPEPGTLLLIGSGVAGLGLARRRNRRK